MPATPTPSTTANARPIRVDWAPTPVDEVDEDWLEFLSLGRAADPSQQGAGSRWAHAPVLLSY